MGNNPPSQLQYCISTVVFVCVCACASVRTFHMRGTTFLMVDNHGCGTLFTGPHTRSHAHSRYMKYLHIIIY